MLHWNAYILYVQSVQNSVPSASSTPKVLTGAEMKARMKALKESYPGEKWGEEQEPVEVFSLCIFREGARFDRRPRGPSAALCQSSRGYAIFLWVLAHVARRSPHRRASCVTPPSRTIATHSHSWTTNVGTASTYHGSVHLVLMTGEGKTHRPIEW